MGISVTHEMADTGLNGGENNFSLELPEGDPPLPDAFRKLSPENSL